MDKVFLSLVRRKVGVYWHESLELLVTNSSKIVNINFFFEKLEKSLVEVQY